MAIRKCTEADADAVARLCARGELALNASGKLSGVCRLMCVGITAACSDDPLLGDLLHPYRKEYPEDFVAYFRRRFVRNFGNASSHHIVAIEVRDGLDTITGYGDWARRHAGDEGTLSESSTAGNAVQDVYLLQQHN